DELLLDCFLDRRLELFVENVLERTLEFGFAFFLEFHRVLLVLVVAPRDVLRTDRTEIRAKEDEHRRRRCRQGDEQRVIEGVLPEGRPSNALENRREGRGRGCLCRLRRYRVHSTFFSCCVKERADRHTSHWLNVLLERHQTI